MKAVVSFGCLLVMGAASLGATSFSDLDARAKSGEELTVAFFGGSLTWSANATEPNVTGFRGLMAKYLAEKYSAAHFTFVDAGIAGFEKAIREGAVCRVPEKPVFGTVKDLRRWNPVDGTLPKGWTRKLTYRTSLWYDGLSSRWMEDVAAFAGAERSPLTVEATGNFFGVFGEADERVFG